MADENKLLEAVEHEGLVCEGTTSIPGDAAPTRSVDLCQLGLIVIHSEQAWTALKAV